jgi:hypothetical protein
MTAKLPMVEDHAMSPTMRITRRSSCRAQPDRNPDDPFAATTDLERTVRINLNMIG